MSGFWKYFLFLWMTLVILAAFFYAPPIEGLGQSGRIVFFHVPCAWIACLAYISSAWCGMRYLASRDFKWDIASASAAYVGLIFIILATVSGAIWAESAWGKWWNWDPKQTAVFIVLLVYGAYFSLRISIEQPEQRAAISAVYTILAMFAAIFLIFFAARMIGSLHPEAPVMQRGGMEAPVRMVFFASLAGFTGLFFWMWRIQTAVDTLILERRI